MKDTIKILFIEDVKFDAELIWRELKKSNIVFKELLVDNKKDYISGLRSFNPDLIISDYSLPQFSGMQALLIRNEISPLTPFILVTGSNNETVAVECMKAGADDYILKDNLSRLGLSAINSLHKCRLIREKLAIEEELIQSEIRFKQITDHSGEWIWEVDKEGLFTYSSNIVKDILGYEPEEIINKKYFFDFFLPDEREKLKRAALSSFALKESFQNFINHNLHKDGSLVILSTSGIPVLDKSGRLICYRGVDTDITNRNKAEEDIILKNKELLYLNTLATDLAGMSNKEDMPAFLMKNLKEFTNSEFLVFSEFDADNQVLITKHIEAGQKTLKKIINIAGDKIINRPAPIRFNEKSFKELITEIVSEKKSLAEISFGAIPTFIDKAFGSLIGFDKYIGLSYVVAGELYGTSLIGFKNSQKTPSLDLLKSFSHIAAVSLQRKKTEEKLKNSEEYYRTLIDTSPDGIIIADLEGIVSYGSIKAHEIFGVPAGEDIKGTSVLKWIAMDSQNSIMERFTDIIKGNIAPETHEYKLCKLDGTELWGELSSSPISDSGGNSNALLIVCRDVSGRKVAESELIKAKEKAEEGDRLKTAFLHNISHEIRTPMNAIIGFSSLLGEPDVDAQSQKDFIKMIMQGSNHLLSIISDIIDISNIEANIVKVSKNEINVNSLIKSICNQFLPIAATNNIQLTCETGVPDSGSLIITDSTKLTQILNNLISNALKFTDKGHVEFGCVVRDKFLELHVSDTGIGIREEDYQKIFDRFYQVDHSVSRLFEGTGLGLAISRANVELMGGENMG